MWICKRVVLHQVGTSFATNFFCIKFASKLSSYPSCYISSISFLLFHRTSLFMYVYHISASSGQQCCHAYIYMNNTKLRQLQHLATFDSFGACFRKPLQCGSTSKSCCSESLMTTLFGSCSIFSFS